MKTKARSTNSLVATLFVLTAVFALVIFVSKKTSEKVEATDTDTEVTIQSSPPIFKSGEDVYEDTASTSTDPWDEGQSGQTIKATSEDPNDDNYFLIVCSSASVTPEGGTGNAPSCGATQFCLSTSTTDETEATCTVSTSGYSSESYPWYAYVCDDVVGSQCSSYSQGTLSDGSESPFKVNHRPSFSAVNDGGAVNPGSNVTFTATASDGDTDGTSDTVKVVVCTNTTTAVVLGTPSTCTGGTLYCESSYGASDPSCQYTQPNPYRDISRTVRAFVFDSHEFGASAYQEDSFTPNNIDPVVSAVTVNGGSNITLNDENTSGGITSVVLTATVTDNNSCNDIASVQGFLYRTGIGYGSCTAQDNNNCYYQISCSVGGGNTCDSDNDASASYTCTASVRYHGDPTDGASLTDSTWYAETWKDTILANDNTGGSSHNLEVTTGVEVNSTTAFTVTTALAGPKISYGTMAAGADSGTVDNSDTNMITTMAATGNVGLDAQLSGTTMTYSIYTIPIANQKHSFTTFTYSSGGTALSGSATEYEHNIDKTTITATHVTAPTYWGILVPSIVGAGTYSGTNYINGLKGEAQDW